MEIQDGIHNMLSREKVNPGAAKLRDTYARKPFAPFFQNEFGFFTFPGWAKEGFISEGLDAWDLNWDRELRLLFGFDEIGHHPLMGCGWVEAVFFPAFEEKVIEQRGEHQVIQDAAGRKLLVFCEQRASFMPEYIDHPVKDMKSWLEICEWRLDPKDSRRYSDFESRMEVAKEKANNGYIIEQMFIGGYMFLRSLIGSLELLRMVYDQPEVIHACMEKWLQLTDVMAEHHQQHVTFDELFLSEDICYNRGLLISPEMIREFLFPYYQQLITNIRRRQIDKNRHLYIQVDTDGNCVPMIRLYQELGMDYLSPFEVASGCDVVKLGKEYPELIMRGGIDKRVLATGKEAIDRYLDGILPEMYCRGGYIPTCDHGVPEEVSFENYLHYRKRCLEYA